MTSAFFCRIHTHTRHTHKSLGSVKGEQTPRGQVAAEHGPEGWEDVPKCRDSPPSVAESGLAALGAVNDFGVDGSSKFPSSCDVIGPRMVWSVLVCIILDQFGSVWLAKCAKCNIAVDCF